ncbi:MAG TPA: penicillin-binding protein 2 [Thiotrichales bacterium]|nr:penicillin-binding protein 2 [Thiotrichales bacterium]
MASRLTLKDHLAESRLMLNRSVWALVGVILLMGILLTRLAWLQISNYTHYSTLSNDNRVKLLPIPPTRGLIYDRNGRLLADNLPAFQLRIIPERTPDVDALIEELRKVVEIRDDQIRRFRKALRRQRGFQGVPLLFNLKEDELARLAAIGHRLPGIDIHADLRRYYPYGELTSHTVGYVGRIDERDLRRLDASNYRGTTHVGKLGIEKQYETELHGTVGHQQVETNALGRVMRVLDRTPPVPGTDLYLSLDIRLQQVAAAALGERNGAVVALDPTNGEVLVLLSSPGYDPNLFVDGISTRDYARLRNDPSRPLFNRALLGQYPPGSTIKPMIGLAGLHYGVVNPLSRQFCPGYYVLPGEKRRFHDWKRSGHGETDLDYAITQSCDVYFYDLARNLGIDRIHEFLAPFGLGHRTGIDMVTEMPGLLPSRAWKRRQLGEPWYPGETLNTGIGQGFMLATPLQLAVATATVATRGHPMRPRMIHARHRPGTDRSLAEPPDPLEPLAGISAEHWEYIVHAMRNVVHSRRGTARRIRSKRYDIAGKTGTAQVFGMKEEEEYVAEELDVKLRDHALFIAFAPVEMPRIAVAVVVENGGSGGAVAAPVAGKLLDAFFSEVP